MSTRSTISKIEPDGSITTIYCHFDGYIEGVGTTLKVHYETPEKVNKLLELGALSVLGDTLKECVAYHRDRGEELIRYHNYLISDIPFEEYNYIFKDGRWQLIEIKTVDYELNDSSV